MLKTIKLMKEVKEDLNKGVDHDHGQKPKYC